MSRLLMVFTRSIIQINSILTMGPGGVDEGRGGFGPSKECSTVAIDNFPEEATTPSRGAVVAVCEMRQRRTGWLSVEVAPSFNVTGGVRLKTVTIDELLEYKKVNAWIPGPRVETRLIL